MTSEDFREALKWSLIAAIIVALWSGVLAVRKARAAVPDESGFPGAQEQSNQDAGLPNENLRPVWVIVVLEVKENKLLGVTEFVFPSLQDCQSGALEAKQAMGLQLEPICYARWLIVEPGSVW